MRKFIAKLALLTVVLLPGIAASQEWLPERANREGPGVLLGDSFVFHPGLGVEGGYDTNALRRDNAEGAGRLRITPYADLATRSKRRRVQDEGVVEATPPKIDLRVGLAAYYDMYFSDVNSIDKQDHFGVDTHIFFTLFPQGVFSLITDVTYIRALKPYESSEEHWAWHMIHPGIGFRIRPGGGTLSFEAGYRLNLMLFEDDVLAERNDKMTHDVRFITAWKILPKTSLMAKINFSPILYTGSPDSGSLENTDSLPVRSLFGLQGLLTPRFGLSLFVGYGASFYAQGDDFDSVLAQGELMFFVSPSANIRLGGQRDFVDSYYANYFVQTGGYLKYEQMFGGLVLASLKGDVYHRGYSTLSGNIDTGTSIPAGQTERSDVWIGGTLLIEVRATDWLSFHASGNYQGNVSDFGYDQEYEDADGVTQNTTLPVEFNRFEILAGVRAHY